MGVIVTFRRGRAAGFVAILRCQLHNFGKVRLDDKL